MVPPLDYHIGHCRGVGQSEAPLFQRRAFLIDHAGGDRTLSREIELVENDR